MVARRMPGILDPMPLKQAMEVTAIESIAKEGFCKKKWRTRRFRAPHHNCSVASITGGGRIPVPGEISLAHRGVLFFDELPEFPRSVLESLRQPLEDGHLTVSRAEWKVNFPADFQFVAAMNPCPCGYFSSEDRECHCSKPKIINYLGRLSGPLLDRIDIQVMVNNPRVSLLDKPQQNKEDSKSFRDKIINCRNLQMNRQSMLNNRLSAGALLELSDLDQSSARVFNKAIKHYQLSIRAQQKILRVARTITDLDNQIEIPVPAITEAVSYRAFDQLLKKARNFL
jgi:magnesium chelatase family protein